MERTDRADRWSGRIEQTDRRRICKMVKAVVGRENASFSSFCNTSVFM
ncbi:MAG: hypothetical protein J6M66_08780 [Lachnospiraceae bacterium]|nr:hypothetical protein [Lachnospiraceae bacterium]